ncbi:Rho termination factor N-terminal domain-containing protein [Mycoplasma sp. P36-A1]|uniref:Rho termination factor N-terminal domain-containing protein n=1 Tax=Mycoplasma sp. P36-A1 TaxID=3252900 RepID=UPI003C30D476
MVNQAKDALEGKTTVTVEETAVATESLEDKTVVELRAMAKEAGKTGYSAMKKEELIDLLK